MGDRVWVQCAQCGSLSQVENEDALMSDDDLYTKPIPCNGCKNKTKHLVIGQHKEDVYLLGNSNLDIRYFIY